MELMSRRAFLGATTAAAFATVRPGSRVSARQDEDDPLGVRKDFPSTAGQTYLNTAYIGLMPQPVVDAGRDWLERRAGRSFQVQEMLATTDAARRRFARLVGASEDEIGFLFSTTEGENVVTNSLDFQPGDNVVIDDLTYPSTPVIYKRLDQTHGVELRIVEHRDGATPVEDFAKHVDARTRLISVAWVSNTSGYRSDMPALANLAHAHDAYLYADAVQAVGMGPIDAHAAGVDFFTTGAYKWLMAGFGVAPFYVRRELLDRIHPDRVGWRVEERLDGYEYRHYRTAKKFEYASLAFGSIYQLDAALAYLEEIGLDTIETQSLSLVAQLRAGLADQGFRIFTPEGTRSSIVSFYIEQSPADARQILDATSVKVSVQNGNRTDAYGRSGSPLNRVRVSLSFFNNGADVERFLEVSERLSPRAAR